MAQINPIFVSFQDTQEIEVIFNYPKDTNFRKKIIQHTTIRNTRTKKVKLIVDLIWQAKQITTNELGENIETWIDIIPEYVGTNKEYPIEFSPKINEILTASEYSWVNPLTLEVVKYWDNSMQGVYISEFLYIHSITLGNIKTLQNIDPLPDTMTIASLENLLIIQQIINSANHNRFGPISE